MGRSGMIAIVLFVAYLLGSFPTGVVLSRAFTGQDIRQVGSGNIGASNVARTAGFGAGVAVGLVDIAKGLIPVLLGRWAGFGSGELALVAVASVLGHDYSIF